MSDVDPVVGDERRGGRERGQQERAIRGAEPVEHGAQVGLAHARFGEQLVEPKRAANGSAFPVDFRQRPERLLDRELLSGALGENLVGVARQRLPHAPDVVIGLPRKAPGAAGGGLRAGPVPEPHQAMLQHRKLIELVAAIVESRSTSSGSIAPPAFSIGLRIASSSWLRVRLGTRYWVALTASDRPWK